MKCEICGNDLYDLLVLLPKRQPDGKLVTFACVGCSIESGMYCQRHQRPHLGFDDETSACMICIDEQVEKDGERIVGQLSGTISRSEHKEEIKRDIDEWLQLIEWNLPNADLGDLPLAIKYIQTPHTLNIARAVVTYSQRMRVTPEEVIERVGKDGTSLILPKFSL